MNAALQTRGIALGADRLIALRALAVGPGGGLSPVSGLPGGHAVRRRGQGQDMMDVREYVSGDDLRHMDPGSSARTGVPHIRTYSHEQDRAVILVADFRPAMLWGMRRAFRSVAAAEALAIEGWRAAEDGARVGALVIGPNGVAGTQPRARRRGVLDAIGAMVREHARALAAADTRDPPLDACLATLDRLSPIGADIVLATALDAPGDDLPGTLGRLGARRHPRILLIGADDTLPPGAYPVAGPDGQRFRVRIGDDRQQGRVRAAGSGPITRMLDLVSPAGRPIASGQHGNPAPPAASIVPEGVPVMRFDAGDEPECVARRLAAASG